MSLRVTARRHWQQTPLPAVRKQIRSRMVHRDRCAPAHAFRRYTPSFHQSRPGRFELLQSCADEHVLLTATAIVGLASRRSGRRVKQIATHGLVTMVAASILPHILKTLFDQERPDRESFARHRHGIPYSGKPRDAFPSGHAAHMGALAALATLLPRDVRYGTWAAAAILVTTRAVLLAHLGHRYRRRLRNRCSARAHRPPMDTSETNRAQTSKVGISKQLGRPCVTDGP